MRRKQMKGKRQTCRPRFCFIEFLLFTVALLLCPSWEQAWAFKIVVPKEGTVLKSGETIQAQVDVGDDPGIVEVRYYWYGELDDTLVEKAETSSMGTIVAKPFLVSTAQNEPPFGGALPVPRESIGPMRLLAVAEISRGRLGGRTIFDEVLVKVEPDAELQSIEFETEKPLRLGRPGQSQSATMCCAPAAGMETYGQVDSLGKIFELPVIGIFSDGVERPIRYPSQGTTYYSSNEKVIKVHPGGLLQVVGNGKTTLTVENRGRKAELDVQVDVGDEVNEPPIADAGQPKTVKAGTRVQLNGLKSRDPEGGALFYAWSQVRGSKVPLLDVNMPVASFVAPQVSEERLFRFKLRVTDNRGADSLPAYVDIIVEP